MDLKRFKLFLRTYWQFAKSTVDFPLFLLGISSLYFGYNVDSVLPKWLGFILFFILLFFAAVRTWNYEHNKRKELENKWNKLNNFDIDHLSQIQKEILKNLSKSAEKEIHHIHTPFDLVLLGIDNLSVEHDKPRVEADLDDLVDRGILKVDKKDNSNLSIYRPTKKAFPLMDQLVAD